MTTRERPKILCVDDEPLVLEGLALHLRRRYDLVTAGSGAQALELLAADIERSFAVIISDMRMPGMDGASFLARARDAAPDATRLLLTGQSDLASTIAAVNQGRIFRFLAKPCPPVDLLAAVGEAVEQNRLVTAERVLLEQTLRGAIQALVDVLALQDPESFGRASRVKQIATEVARALGVSERWTIEVAALLTQLGTVGLPSGVAQKLYRGEDLTKDEQAMVDRGPAVTERLLAPIPRLEIVRGILAAARKQGRVDPSWTEAHRSLVVLGGQIVAAASDYAVYELRGESPDTALGTLRAERYPPEVLAALAGVVGSSAVRAVSQVRLAQLRPGMVLVDEMRTVAGALLCPRGFTITETFVERLQNLRPGTVREPIRVSI